ncbi:MAG: hypothetical protein AAFZ15_30260 [Bacteroidota bacterium]
MKNITSLFVLLILPVIPVFCQLEKGDLSIRFGSGLSRWSSRWQDDQGSRSNSFSLSSSIGYMVSDRLMLGSGVSVLLAKGEDPFSGEVKNHRYSVSPFVRYYFLEEKRFMPYLFASSRLMRYKYLRESSPDNTSDGWVASGSGGFGANYFLGPNIALNSYIGTTLFQNRWHTGSDETLFGRVGIQLFINDRTPFEKGIQSNYLCKGNMIFSGGANLSIDDWEGMDFRGNPEIYAKPQEVRYYISPAVKYFISDHTAVSGRVSFSGYDSGTRKNLGYGLSAGIETFIPVNKQLFLVPSITVGAQREHSTNYYLGFPPIFGGIGTSTIDTIEDKRIDYYIDGKLEISLRYFTEGASVFSAGTTYYVNHFIRPEFDYRYSWANFIYFLRHEYFFAKNLSFNTTLSYSRQGNNRDGSFIFFIPSEEYQRNLNLSFSISYFMFNGKCAASNN